MSKVFDGGGINLGLILIIWILPSEIFSLCDSNELLGGEFWVITQSKDESYACCDILQKLGSGNFFNLANIIQT